MKIDEKLKDTRGRQKSWINEIKEKTGHSYSRIAKEINVSQTTITRFMDDKQHNGALSALTEAKIKERYGSSNYIGNSSRTVSIPKKSMLDGSYGRVDIPEYDVRASAGGGEIVDAEEEKNRWSVPIMDLLKISPNPRDLRIITVEGDSMEPDYLPGERILIDTSFRHFSKDGVYVLDFGFGLVIKHLQLIVGSKPEKLRIISSNSVYEPQEVPLKEAHIKGKVAAKWQRRG